MSDHVRVRAGALRLDASAVTALVQSVSAEIQRRQHVEAIAARYTFIDCRPIPEETEAPEARWQTEGF